MGGDGHERQGEQQDAGHGRRDGEHDDEGHEERHQLADQAAHAAQEFVERLDVVGDAGHHPAHGDAVVELRRAGFEMGEEVATQVSQAIDDGGDQGHAVVVAGHGP